MAEPIAVLALRRKRDQIFGTIAHYERLLREAQHDLAHVNASLRLFEAAGAASDLPPYVDRNWAEVHSQRSFSSPPFRPLDWTMYR